MKFHHAVVLIIIISMIATSITIYIGDLGDGYSQTADFSNLNLTEARIERQREIINDTYDDIKKMTLEESSGVLVVPYVVFKTAIGSAKLIFTSWTSLGTIISEMADTSPIPVPDWFILSIIGLIMTSLVAMLIYAFIKWKMED
jgi:succinate dehydrogenase hydrophobic anchor subunit